LTSTLAQNSSSDASILAFGGVDRLPSMPEIPPAPPFHVSAKWPGSCRPSTPVPLRGGRSATDSTHSTAFACGNSTPGAVDASQQVGGTG